MSARHPLQPTGEAARDNLVRERLRLRREPALCYTPALPGMDLASVRALLVTADIREDREDHDTH